MGLDIAELILFIVLIILLLIFACTILIKTKGFEDKIYYYGMIFFLVSYSVCRILILIDDQFFTGNWILYQWGSFFGSIASFGIMFVVEKYIYSKLHYIPSIAILGFGILMIVFPTFNETNLITYWAIFGALIAIIIPILYIYIGFKSTGALKNKCFIIAFGIIIFFIGNGLNTGALRDIIPILAIIAPLTMICGILIFQYGLLFYKLGIDT